MARTGAVSADGHQVAIGYDDGSIEIRELATGRLQHEFSGGTNATDPLRFSPDGHLLAARNRNPPKAAMVGAFTLWDARTGARLPELPAFVEDRACSFEFSHHGKWLAVGRADDSVLIWDLTGQRELLRPMSGHSYDIVSLAFSPDDQTLASASWDTTVRLWDVATGREKRILPGHKLCAGYVSFSPDGQTLATAAGDDVVRLWHVTSGQEMMVLQPFRVQSSMFTEVRFSPDGNTLAASWPISMFSAPTNSSAQFWYAPSLRGIDAPRFRDWLGLR